MPSRADGLTNLRHPKTFPPKTFAPRRIGRMATSSSTYPSQVPCANSPNVNLLPLRLILSLQNRVGKEIVRMGCELLMDGNVRIVSNGSIGVILRRRRTDPQFALSCPLVTGSSEDVTESRIRDRVEGGFIEGECDDFAGPRRGRRGLSPAFAALFCGSNRAWELDRFSGVLVRCL